jgi:hypothetical protein
MMAELAPGTAITPRPRSFLFEYLHAFAHLLKPGGVHEDYSMAKSSSKSSSSGGLQSQNPLQLLRLFMYRLLADEVKAKKKNQAIGVKLARVMLVEILKILVTVRADNFDTRRENPLIAQWLLQVLLNFDQINKDGLGPLAQDIFCPQLGALLLHYARDVPSASDRRMYMRMSASVLRQVLQPDESGNTRCTHILRSQLDAVKGGMEILYENQSAALQEGAKLFFTSVSLQASLEIMVPPSLPSTPPPPSPHLH